MSNNSLHKENENQQNNDSNARDNGHTSYLDSISFGSERSSNLSNTSHHKQLKSAHTISKTSQGRSYLSPTSSQSNNIDHYKRLLNEADQALTSRDSLILILQEQLKKMENLYKKSLDETQDFRFKYCITTKECRNLKKICEKYRTDIDDLTKERSNCNNSCDNLVVVKDEADNWKLQYNELSKKMESMEKDLTMQKEDRSSKDVKVELLEFQSSKCDIEVLKDHYADIQKILNTQNEKLELLVEKQQEDLAKSERDRIHLESMLTALQEKLITNTTEASVHISSMEKLLKENKILNEQLDNLKEQNENLLHEDSQILNNQDLEKSNENLRMEDLQNEIQFLRTEVQKLHMKNIELQMKTDENNLEDHNNETLTHEELGYSSSWEHGSIAAKDSITEKLKVENEELRRENANLTHLCKIFIPGNFKECICPVAGVDTSTSKHINIIKGGHGSRVSFAVPGDIGPLITNKSPITSDSGLMDDLSLEIVNLRRQLKDEEDEEQYLVDEFKIALQKRDEVIQELTCRNELLKHDYEEYVAQGKISSKANMPDDHESVVERLRSEIEQIKEQLSTSQHTYAEVLREKDTIANELNDKTDQLNKNKLDLYDLQEKIDKLQVMISAVKEENKKYIQERCCYEEAQTKYLKLEAEVNKIPLVTQKLKEDGDLFAVKIDDMNQTLQQYKEEAEFKKMENEKLIKNEEHLQCLLSRLMEESEQNAKEYQEELEKHKKLLISLQEECDCLKTSSQGSNNKLNDENQVLLNQLHVKDEEIKKLNEKIEEVTLEYKNDKLHLQKIQHINERSLSEISCLFKCKENEIAEIGRELLQHEINLERLKEENNALRVMLNETKNMFHVDEKQLQEAIHGNQNEKQKQLELSHNIEQTNEEIKLLNVKYLNEKSKNSEYSNFVTNMSNELVNLKMELQALLQNLEYKLTELKEDIKNNKHCEILSTNAVDEMANQIEAFNKFLLYGSNTIESQNMINKTENQFKSPEIFSKDSNTKPVICDSICRNVNTERNSEELLLKREYFVKKIESIDLKLRTSLDCQSPRNGSQTELNKNSLSNVEHINELCFQRKFCSDSIDCIDKILHINNKFDEDKGNNLSNDDSNSVLENMEQLSSDSTKTKQNNCQTCNLGMKEKIDDLQKQVKATFSLTEHINELESQLKKKHSLCDGNSYSLLPLVSSVGKDAAPSHEDEVIKDDNLSGKSELQESVRPQTQYFLGMNKLMESDIPDTLQSQDDDQKDEVIKNDNLSDKCESLEDNVRQPQVQHFLDMKKLMEPYIPETQDDCQGEEMADAMEEPSVIEIPEHIRRRPTLHTIKNVAYLHKPEENENKPSVKAPTQYFLQMENLIKLHKQDVENVLNENKQEDIPDDRMQLENQNSAATRGYCSRDFLKLPQSVTPGIIKTQEQLIEVYDRKKLLEVNNSEKRASPRQCHLPLGKPTQEYASLKQCRANAKVRQLDLPMKSVGTGIPVLIHKAHMNTKCAGCQTIAVTCKPKWKNVCVSSHHNKTGQKICGKPKDEQPKTSAMHSRPCSCLTSHLSSPPVCIRSETGKCICAHVNMKHQ